ncbi:MAG: ABC transporter ATP-binding protein [Eubacteriaceae bacterium]
MKVIETVHLTKNYGETLALKNVNLSVDEGEILGFVGPNGAGKSTFIKVLLNFIYPTIGQAKILGLNCAKDGEKIKKVVGYVPSEVRFYPNETPEELLKATLAFHKNDNEKNIQPLCEALDIDRGKKFRELSMGNKKKVAIACALINKPQLLILDEPTSGLDPLIQRRLFELLREENQNGTTVFVSSHNLKEVQEHCTRVAFIKEGRIIKEDDLNKTIKHLKIIEMSANYFDQRDLDDIGGKILKISEKKVKFSYDGDVERLLRILNRLNLKDITIKKASLEDEFLNYYEGGNADDTGEAGI